MFKIHVQNICNNVEREDFEKRTWYKLAGIRNCLKSKESVNEGLRYKTLVFYDKAVT